MKGLALFVLVALTTLSAHAKGVHYRVTYKPEKYFEGATDSKPTAVTSKYVNTQLHSLLKAKEGGSSIYRGMSPEARRQENALLRQNYLDGVSGDWN